MNRTTYQLLLLLCILFLIACSHKKQVKADESFAGKSITHNKDQSLLHLVELMSGEFDSLKQSKEDESYYHISLKMLPIWTELNDGYWLYVEQAVGNMLDKPYRQRIYHVTALGNDKFSSAVYELPDALAVVGGYERPELLAGISPQDLNLRIGCAVILTQISPNYFQGSTDNKTCLSQLRGATYAHSIVEITTAGIKSWDQGFDANDKQVWGAIDGPYVFDRK